MNNPTTINQLENRRILNDMLGGGVIAGLVAGACMAVVLCVHSAAVGMDFWLPIQLMSGVFYGPDAILGGAGPTITGLLVHFVSSAILGFIFALLMRPRTPTSDAVAFGLIFGIVVWALRTYLTLPAFNPTLSDRATLIPGWWFVAHLAFGAGLGSLSNARRSLARRLRVRERPTRVAA